MSAAPAPTLSPPPPPDPPPSLTLAMGVEMPPPPPQCIQILEALLLPLRYLLALQHWVVVVVPLSGKQSQSRLPLILFLEANRRTPSSLLFLSLSPYRPGIGATWRPKEKIKSPPRVSQMNKCGRRSHAMVSLKYPQEIRNFFPGIYVRVLISEELLCNSPGVFFFLLPPFPISHMCILTAVSAFPPPPPVCNFLWPGGHEFIKAVSLPLPFPPADADLAYFIATRMGRIRMGKSRTKAH